MTESISWDQTKLWQLLSKCEGNEAEQIRTTLTVSLPKISQVLSGGTTGPKDFTLHDEGHGRRVAERMPQLIPADVLPKLSPYELAFLLLSAYLHDIGMVPTQRKVSTHHEYLLTGDASLLPPEELDEFQEYLTELTPPVEVPLTSDPVTARELRQAGKLTAFYCRLRHADWSADWIRANLAGQTLGTYKTWIEDLVSLCKSHHWDYDELRSVRLDTRLIGPNSDVVNLRYLACVLRVADILEFDPERTPEIILEHRDVDVGSVVYWQKDHYPSIDRVNDGLLFFATPPNAVLHRALETMAEDIDTELQLCARLSREEPFDRYQGKQLPHRWDYPAYVVQDIKPLDDSYVYIDGTFRPDTIRLLDLLSGTRLYDSPLAAVRELLQNAFDAIKQQIAYARQAAPEPGRETTRELLEEFHTVALRLSHEGDTFWLTCSDTGVGMGRRQIQRRLLVSGRSSDADLVNLRRQSRALGFDFARSGEFGIGVLSYFMIADRFEITTRRSPAAGDVEPHGWEFSTDGPNSLGELRPRPDLQQAGTTVRLRLLPAVVGADADAWFAGLVDYVRQTFRVLPCRLLVEQEPKGAGPSHSWPHGWMTTSDELAAGVEASATQVIKELTREDRYDTDPSLSIVEKALRGIDFGSSLRWRIDEGVVPDRDGLAAGSYRLCIPYFELPDGSTLAATTITDATQDAPIAFLTDAYAEINWHGAAIQTASYGRGWPGPGIIEVDLRSDDFGTVDVKRDSVTLSELAQERLEEIEKRLAECHQAFASETSGSPYFLLNAVVTDTPIPGPLEGLYWPTLPSQQTERCLGAMAAIGPEPPATARGLTWRGREVDVLGEVSLIAGQLPRYNRGWADSRRVSRLSDVPTIRMRADEVRPNYVLPVLFDPAPPGGAQLAQAVQNILNPSLFGDTAGEQAPQQLSKDLLQEIGTRLGQLDDEAIAAANERMSQPWLAVYALTDPNAESPGQHTALGWACGFPPEWADVLRLELPHAIRDWRERSRTRTPLIVTPSRFAWNIDHPIVRAASADGAAWARAEVSEYWRYYRKEVPVDLTSIMSSQSFAAAWLSNSTESFFDNAWKQLEASVRQAIWRKAFNLGEATPLAGRRMITIYSGYTFISVHTPGPEMDAVGMEELPKPSEQWWLGTVPAHDEPS